jgi:ribosomal protein S18 acetylase RimI-like enzyme
MPALKKPRVREAKPRDIGLFRKLWKLYLEDQVEQGGVILPTEDNLEVYVNIFKMYVDEDIPEDAQTDGVVLFIGEVAMIMWGDSDSVVETTMGKTAYAWGVYVMPDHRGQGLSDMLHREAIKKLVEFKFDTVYSSIVTDNVHGYEAFKRGTEREVHNVPECQIYVKL